MKRAIIEYKMIRYDQFNYSLMKRNTLTSLILGGVILHFCTLIWFIDIYPSNPILVEFQSHFYLLLAFSLIISLTIPIYVLKHPFPQMISIIHILTVLMLGYFLGSSLLIEYLLSLVIIAELIFCNNNLKQSTLWIIIFIVLQLILQHKTLIDGMLSPSPRLSLIAIFFVLLVISSIILAHINHLCERLQQSQLHTHQLEQASKLLINANRSFQEYAYDVEEKSKKEERMRITREIHDLVGYSTINISMMMEEAIDHYVNENVNKLFPLILKARDQTKATHQDIRRVLSQYRVDSEEISSLVADVLLMTKKFSEITGIEVDFQAVQSVNSISKNVHSQVLRILQEALTNAIQHGKASTIRINLTTFRQNIHLIIEDNGKGAATIKEGIGLSGMRERLHIIGGSLKIINAVGEFKLIIEIPIKEMQ